VIPGRVLLPWADWVLRLEDCDRDEVEVEEVDTGTGWVEGEPPP
jgi:hypothetical protein